MKAKASWWGSRLARQSMRAVVAYLRRAHTAAAAAAAISFPLACACRVAPCYARVPSLSRPGVSPSVARATAGTSLPPSRSLPRRVSLAPANVLTYARRAVLLFEPGRPAERSPANTIRSRASCAYACVHANPDESYGGIMCVRTYEGTYEGNA